MTARLRQQVEEDRSSSPSPASVLGPGESSQLFRSPKPQRIPLHNSQPQLSSNQTHYIIRLHQATNMADESSSITAVTAEAAAQQPFFDGGRSIAPHVGTVQYDAPVIHPAHAAADRDVLPVVHDPNAADVTAQAAQAIAASASAYNIPTTGIIADAAYAGYAVDQSHGAYANTAAAHHVNNAVANRHSNATGMEYMAMAASTAAPEQEMVTTAVHDAAVTAPAAHAFTEPIVQAQPQPQQQPHLEHLPNANGRYPQPQPTAVETRHQQPHIEHLPNANGRYAMDVLLKEQKQAIFDLNLAEEEFARAQERLNQAKQHKIDIDKRVKENAESMTEELLKENSRWNEMYQCLVEYKREHGHCHVMRNPKRNESVRRKQSPSEKANLQALGTWVGQVRLEARRPVGHPDRLEPYKIIALDRLGFDWEPRENYWMDMYEQLKVYLEKNGGSMPPRFINNAKFALGQWCDTQLDNYRKFNSGKKGAYITQEKIDMLNQIGFIWDKRGQQWKDNYDRLKEFKAQHGHCNATASNNGGDKSFGTWVTKQKRKYCAWKRGETKLEISLTAKQAALLDEIGFSQSVEVDGRKLRKLSKTERPQRAMKYSLLNGTIAGLVNASEEIEGRSEDVVDKGQQDQQMEPPSTGTDVQTLDETHNNNMAETVANNWGDSANAVSLLVDAIMNQGEPSRPV